ncbi:TPA: winged helix-turn-helix domain-containing protein [Escherichia coli]|nr:winged helix-turn-helix domain-containing protein [Escherichia coli]HDW8129047.1 winged helix-turn-helix domain-containing protein [Escherichia coli]
MGRFLIGETIVFDPDRRIIYSENQTVRLHSSCVYCLELLIEHQGEIVEHEAFYEYVWRRFGMEVGPNALYQSISMLRKALSTCGTPDNIILTAPRRGFSLSQEMHISCDNLQEAMDEQSSDWLNGSDKMNETHGENLMKEMWGAIPSESEMMEISSEYVRDKQCRKRKIDSSIFYYILILLTILSLIVPVYLVFLSDGEHYSKRFEFNGCYVYSRDASNDNNTMDIVLKTGIKCEDRRYVYVTYFQGGDRESLIQCRKPLSTFSLPNCISYYNIGKI